MSQSGVQAPSWSPAANLGPPVLSGPLRVPSSREEELGSSREGYTGAMLARSMGQHREEGKLRSLGADLNHRLGPRAPGTHMGRG